MKNNKEKKELLGMIEDLTFDFSDAMDDLGAGIRCDELPSNAKQILAETLAKFAHANFTLSAIRNKVQGNLED